MKLIYILSYILRYNCQKKVVKLKKKVTLLE